MNPNIGETFVIVNPGQGVNNTYNGFYNFLYGLQSRTTGSFALLKLPADDSGDTRL